MLLGGPAYFRGVLKALFNLLGTTKAAVAVSYAVEPLQQLHHHARRRLHRVHSLGYRRRRAPGPEIGPVDHVLAIVGRRPVISGYTLVFGSIAHGVRLSTLYNGEDFEVGYIVDPLREGHPPARRLVAVNPQLLPTFDRLPRYTEGTASAGLEKRLQALRGLAEKES